MSKKQIPIKPNISVNLDNINHRILGADDTRLSHDKIKSAKDFVELKTRYRSLEIYIENKTSSVMNYEGSYFDTGDWYYQLKTKIIEPGQTWFQACANKDGKAFSGVTGGCSFSISGKRLGFGFCNPFMGCIKCSIVQGNSLNAYDAAEDGKTKKVQIGKYSVTAWLDDAKYGGHKAIFQSSMMVHGSQFLNWIEY